MTKLTVREKKLICLLILISVFAFSFMFLFKPILETRKEQQIKIEQLKKENDSVDIMLKQLDQLNNKLKEKQKYIETESAHFYKEIYTWDAERVVTSIAKKNSLEVTKIAILPSEKLEPVVNNQSEQINKANDMNNIVEVISVSMGYSSSLESLKGFLDDFASLDKKVTIQDWKYEIKEGKLLGNLTVQLYVIKT
ncbi:hypothetical protein RBG61_08800 [Paludicola sp. MB14-C6]|uniref:hypothetical protein n=1 Tax=Paludihabitans sp. MB14-C6 TaxID=3070656 RepID=UPI0027DDA503|nr:hypothetical protein [Paludicola sp. MB14-C6]WMJ22098.1 hypothetical protein RBG61_08800 [Paludicola sp. MB14-C6]